MSECRVEIVEVIWKCFRKEEEDDRERSEEVNIR